MTWVAEKTWNTGDVLPASDLNIYLRDNLVFLHDKGADVSVAAGVLTVSSQFHVVTGGGTLVTVTGPTGAGHLMRLQFSAATIVEHNGGGTGNVFLFGGTPGYARTFGIGEWLVLSFDGTNWTEVVSSPHLGVVLKLATPFTTAASVAEQTLFSKTIPGLGVDSIVRFHFWGDGLQNASPTPTARWKLTLDGVAVFDTGAQIMDQVASRLPFEIRGVLENLGATNSQAANGRLESYIRPGGDGVLVGGWTVGEALVVHGASNGGYEVNWHTDGLTVDTSTAKTLALTVQFSTASGSMQAKLYGGLVEIL